MDENNIEIEATLKQVRPQATAALRDRVASSVHAGLRQAARKRGLRSVALSFSFLVGTIIVCAAASSYSNARLASLFGPERPPRHVVLLAKDIEEMTNKEVANWFIQRAMGK